MKITSKGRYAVTAMLDIAINSHLHPVRLQEISTRQAISLPYLEQLFAKLRKQQLVSSVRGPGGGYLIVPSLDQISIDDIIQAVDEDLDATKCQSQGNCQHGQQCLTHSLWCELSQSMRAFLANISLADLMNKQDVQQILMRQQGKQPLNLMPDLKAD
tara:strand:+ start:3854 stop:4327 length:474 start_codon:yes stop_codon:yes gene_type:complete